MPERRRADRRTNPAVPEPLERKTERRSDDRRESVRRSAAFMVRHGDARDEVEGELGLGGASFRLPAAPKGPDICVEWRLGRQTFALEGQVVSTTRARGTHLVHVRFAELDTRTALALARWLDAVDE